MTTRERLHQLGEVEAEAALVRLQCEHDALRRWADQPETDATQDALALRNAREAIREEPW
jgi:hypothetical protein